MDKIGIKPFGMCSKVVEDAKENPLILLILLVAIPLDLITLPFAALVIRNAD